MKYLFLYLRNLGLFALAITAVVFAARWIFPSLLPLVGMLERTYRGLPVWTIITVLVFIIAVPRREN